MEGFFTIVGIIVLGFITFMIYFAFKQIEFVLVSVKLYRKMVSRLDAAVVLLQDVRDNTKTFAGMNDDAAEDSTELAESEPEEDGGASFCYHCGEALEVAVPVCPHCGKSL